MTGIQTPASGSPGEQGVIGWTVTNQSANALPGGKWTDAVYLSTDIYWSINDQLVGRAEHSGAVAAGGSYTASLTADLPPVTPGAYYVIVRTDVRNNVREDREDNNISIAATPMAVDVMELTLGTPVNSTLWTGRERYFKVNAPASETLLFTLDAESNDIDTELYARYGAMASRSAYDFLYEKTWSADQQILVPTTQAGYYYAMAAGQASQADGAFSMEAEIIPFSVRSVSPMYIGDNGQVTITLSGAKFADGDTVTLTSGATTLTAGKVWAVDGATLKARFFLTDVPHGAYDVTVTSPASQTATAAQAVTVETATELTGPHARRSRPAAARGGYGCPSCGCGEHREHRCALRYPRRPHHVHTGPVDHHTPVQHIPEAHRAVGLRRRDN